MAYLLEYFNTFKFKVAKVKIVLSRGVNAEPLLGYGVLILTPCIGNLSKGEINKARKLLCDKRGICIRFFNKYKLVLSLTTW